MPRFRIPLPMSGPRRRWRYFGRRAGIGGLAGLVVLGLVGLDRFGLFGRPNQDDFTKFDGQTCKVVHVTDGDTVDVGIPDGSKFATRIRLLGIDTPETVAPDKPVGYFGPEASNYTKSRLLHKTITLQLDKSRSPRDKYGRLLAYLLFDGKNFNRQIIADGYAYADPRFPHPLLKDFKAVQEQAKAAGVGLWHGVQDKDLPYYYQGKLKLAR